MITQDQVQLRKRSDTVKKAIPWFISMSLNVAGLFANFAYGNKSIWGPIGWSIIAVCWITYFIRIRKLALIIGPVMNLVSQIRNIVMYIG